MADLTVISHDQQLVKGIDDNVQDIVDRNNGHDIVDSFVSTSSVLSYYDDSKRSNLIPIRVSPPGLYPAGG